MEINDIELRQNIFYEFYFGLVESYLTWFNVLLNSLSKLFKYKEVSKNED